jgi:hypothetical protein
MNLENNMKKHIWIIWKRHNKTVPWQIEWYIFLSRQEARDYIKKYGDDFALKYYKIVKYVIVPQIYKFPPKPAHIDPLCQLVLNNVLDLTQ